MSEIMEAWRTWWLAGQLPAGLKLLGISLLWWGRIGKVLEFVAALTIVADIIGAARLRSFGTSLHGTVTLAGLKRVLGATLKWYKSLSRHFFSSDRKELDREVAKFPGMNFHYLVALTLIVGPIIYIYNRMALWATVLIGCGFYMVVSLVIAPFVTALLIMAAATLGYLLDVILIEPIAWVLDRDSLDRWVKLASLLMLVVGFHFDLLAS